MVRRALLFFLVSILLLGPVRGRSLAATKPQVVLVTLDSTRADRVGFLGARGRLTPALDSLARQAIVFEHAYAQAPLTVTSHATILTGTYPQTHHLNEFASALGANLPYLADLLRAHGYRTAAFVGSILLDPKNGSAPGFDRGFDIYDAGFESNAAGQHIVARPGD